MKRQSAVLIVTAGLLCIRSFAVGTGDSGAVEQIEFVSVGEIKPIAQGRFQATLRLADGQKQSEMCAIFEPVGKDFLERAQKKYVRWKKQEDESKAKGPKLKVTKKMETRHEGNTFKVEPIVKDVKLVKRTVPRQPSFSVYGKASTSDCWILVGSQERVGIAGSKTYSW